MLYSPQGYKYSKMQWRERLGWDLRGSKLMPQKSCGMNPALIRYDDMTTYCTTADVQEVFVAGLASFQADLEYLYYKKKQNVWMQSNWKTLETEVWGAHSSVQQQITISHLHEHPKDHQELLWKKALIYSLVSPLYIKTGALNVKFIGILKTSHPINMPYAYSMVLCPTAFTVRNTFKWANVQERCMLRVL